MSLNSPTEERSHITSLKLLIFSKRRCFILAGTFITVLLLYYAAQAKAVHLGHIGNLSSTNFFKFVFDAVVTEHSSGVLVVLFL